MFDTESPLQALTGVGWIRGELPASGMVTVHHSNWVQTQCSVDDVEPVN